MTSMTIMHYQNLGLARKFSDHPFYPVINLLSTE